MPTSHFLHSSLIFSVFFILYKYFFHLSRAANRIGPAVLVNCTGKRLAYITVFYLADALLSNFSLLSLFSLLSIDACKSSVLFAMRVCTYYAKKRSSSLATFLAGQLSCCDPVDDTFILCTLIFVSYCTA